MNKTRLEAYSDAVIAIIITIMVLELKAPHGHSYEALRDLIPAFMSYVLSFCYIAIYWNNHHHLFQAVKHVQGPALWANHHLLFWLSLFPFATAWLGENGLGREQCLVYGIVLIGAAIAYSILTKVLLKHHEADSTLAKAIGRDLKGKLSVALYALGVALAFVSPMTSCALYVFVALVWVIPDKRIEKVLAK